MASEEKKSGFCAYCNKNVMVARPKANHILHLLLTILTAGIWGIVWIFLVAIPKKWRCSACGNYASGAAPLTEIPTPRQCPYCAETINAKAKKCMFCQSEVKPTHISENIVKTQKNEEIQTLREAHQRKTALQWLMVVTLSLILITLVACVWKAILG